jgi:anti-sigma28 factor (negative regulator of flagellin synthesis)
MPGPCDIDSILVAVLRDRVARGEYRVDARTVARKLIAAHGL